MGRGIGKTQQQILHALTGEAEHEALTVADLAERVGASPRQIRTAVRALEGRGLVAVSKEHLGWKGRGEYGRRRYAWRFVEHPRGDRVRRRNDPTGPLRDVRSVDPDDPSWIRGFYRRSDELLEPDGMPVVALFVWLLEDRIALPGRPTGERFLPTAFNHPRAAAKPRLAP